MDIVERLRNVADEGYRFAGDAADEIVRLRADLAATHARAVRMVELMRKLREPDWHIESVREFQRELNAMDTALLSDDSALREMIKAARGEEREACASLVDVNQGVESWEIHGGQETIDVLRDLAAAIRARKAQ